MSDLPEGYRWATEEEMNRPDAIVVKRTADKTGRPYTQDEADLAVPVESYMGDYRYPNQPFVDAVTQAYNANTRSPAQHEIAEKADELLQALDRLVPDTTVHYAVEDARRAMRTLIREAHAIKTIEVTT